MKKIYSLLISFLLFSFLPLNVYGLDVTGTIDSDQSWGTETVNVNGNLTISATVTISAGTQIIVADQVMITVTSSGSIQAQGTDGNEIVFTAATPAVGWRGIYFDSGIEDDAPSIFQYTRFEYGKADGSGGAINLDYHSSVTFQNCSFENNQASNYGGAINSAYSQLVLENCVFSSNQAGGSDGGGAVHIFDSDEHELRIENCSFFNNNAYTGGAIQAENAAGLIVSGCLFANNEAYSGGAVTISQSSSDNITFIANTIVNNKTNYSSDAAINVATYVSNFSFINNIIYNNLNGSGNTGAIFFSSEPYEPVFENCLIEGGVSSISGLPSSYTWTEIMDDNPGFVAPSSGVGLAADGSAADWQLSETSPCVNAGIEDVTGLGLPDYDLAGNTRIQQGRIDIGALESAYVPTASFDMPVDVDFNIWLQRDANQIVVRTDDMIRFSGALYDITGSIVEDKRNRLYQDQLTFPVSGLRKGIYVVTLYGRSGEVLSLSKIVVN
jgi:predicted outer membrane repeat protein